MVRMHMFVTCSSNSLATWAKPTALLALFPTLSSFPSLAVCVYGRPKGRLRLSVSLCHFHFSSGFVWKIDYTDCVHVEGLPWILIIVLYLLDQWSEYTSHPMRKSHDQLQDVSPGWEQRFTQHSISPIPLVRSVIVKCCSCMYAQFCFWWFINCFHESGPFSPLQSTD